MKNTAVMISGRGTNLQAIIDQWKSGQTGYQLKLVFSNVEQVEGLSRAKAAGIETLVISHRDFATREEFDRRVYKELMAKNIELIALAGFMRLFSSWFVQQWSGKIINIHPSLLPAFPGLDTHQKALDAGVKYSGCTVFFVDEGVDTGAIIDQIAVPVHVGDTEESLAKRILKKEHELYPKVLDDLACGKVVLEQGKCRRVEFH